MLAVYFSLPQAAWQNVTVKSSRHERLTDVYFAIRLHALLWKDFSTCRGMPCPSGRAAVAPAGNPAAFDQSGSSARSLRPAGLWKPAKHPIGCTDLHLNHQHTETHDRGACKVLESHHTLRTGSLHPQAWENSALWYKPWAWLMILKTLPWAVVLLNTLHSN